MKSKLILITLALFLSDANGYRLRQKDADEDKAMAALEQAINAETGDEASKEVEKEDEAPAAAPAAAAPYVAPDDDAEQEGEKKVDDIDRLMDKYDHEEDAKKFKKTDKFKAG